METNLFEKATILDFSALVEYSANGIVSKRVLEKKTGNISLFAFDKGQSLSEHTAPFDAMAQVLEGKGEIVINGKSFLLEAGKSIIMPANIPHAVNAVAKFKMLLTMIKETCMSLATEKRTIAAIISIYCKDNHHTINTLCDECSDLRNYALKRIEQCPYQASKPACNTCTVHCYAPEKRERVRQVMRYSGKKNAFATSLS